MAEKISSETEKTKMEDEFIEMERVSFLHVLQVDLCFPQFFSPDNATQFSPIRC